MGFNFKKSLSFTYPIEIFTDEMICDLFQNNGDIEWGNEV